MEGCSPLPLLLLLSHALGLSRWDWSPWVVLLRLQRRDPVDLGRVRRSHLSHRDVLRPVHPDLVHAALLVRVPDVVVLVEGVVEDLLVQGVVHGVRGSELLQLRQDLVRPLHRGHEVHDLHHAGLVHEP